MSGGGGGGGRSLSMLGIALTIIFVVSLLALLAQFFCALWRRRRRQDSSGGGVRVAADHRSVCSSSSESSFTTKELRYFFCIRPHPRLHSDSITVASGSDDRNSNRRLDMEVVDIDLLKPQGMFGPPRFLFTIKEEEREGFESPADKSLHSADKETKKIEDCIGRNNRVSLEECFKAADAVVELEIHGGGGGGGGDNATPLSTPCASPVFFTPSASPVHSLVNIPTTEEVRICFENKTAPLVTSEQ